MFLQGAEGTPGRPRSRGQKPQRMLRRAVFERQQGKLFPEQAAPPPHLLRHGPGPGLPFRDGLFEDRQRALVVAQARQLVCTGKQRHRRGTRPGRVQRAVRRGDLPRGRALAAVRGPLRPLGRHERGQSQHKGNNQQATRRNHQQFGLGRTHIRAGSLVEVWKDPSISHIRGRPQPNGAGRFGPRHPGWPARALD